MFFGGQLGIGPVQEQNPADHLDECRTALPGQLCCRLFPLDGRILSDFDFNQLPGFERGSGCGNQAGAQAFPASQHHRGQLVTQAAQLFFLRVGQYWRLCCFCFRHSNQPESTEEANKDTVAAYKGAQCRT